MVSLIPFLKAGSFRNFRRNTFSLCSYCSKNSVHNFFYDSLRAFEIVASLAKRVGSSPSAGWLG